MGTGDLLGRSLCKIPNVYSLCHTPDTNILNVNYNGGKKPHIQESKWRGRCLESQQGSKFSPIWTETNYKCLSWLQWAVCLWPSCQKTHGDCGREVSLVGPSTLSLATLQQPWLLRENLSLLLAKYGTYMPPTQFFKLPPTWFFNFSV